MTPTIASPMEWLAARKALLVKEQEMTRLRDEIAAQRRALPWVPVEKPYVFQSADGPKTLGDLFEGRSQLFVQHFMLPPGATQPCPGCSAFADHVDAARRHFENADLSFAAVARAGVAEIEAAKARMGWTFQFVSCGENGFSNDFGAAFTAEEVARGEPIFNFGKTAPYGEDNPANSVFVRNEAGEIFHTYSAYARGSEDFFIPFHFLDWTPKGRNEGAGPMSWVRLHDEYGQ